MVNAPVSVGSQHPRVALYRTAGGGKLHIPPCPHILGAEIFEATADDVESGEICSWCQLEIDGVGREYYDDLDAAIRAMAVDSDAWSEVKDILGPVEHDQIWTPNSLSYAALGLAGVMVAWLGKTYVQFANGTRIELPGYAAGLGGAANTAERTGDICQTCYVEMPLVGPCPNCTF